MKECGLCVQCNKNKQQYKGKNLGYRPLCSSCFRTNRPLKDICSECGFIPKHSCQMDIDHIDGDNFNFTKTNLRVLCSNCHRFKTHINRDYLTRACKLKERKHTNE